MPAVLSDIGNEFRGTVRNIRRGEVMSAVAVDTDHGLVRSLILTRVVDRLGLKPGAAVVARIRSTAVSIAMR